MSIRRHPPIGTLVLCDFHPGFQIPEMVKRRPVVVISPPITRRIGLCTVVALSTTDPEPIMPYHRKLHLHPLLPAPWDKASMWIKGDMINAVGFHRLDFFRIGRKKDGTRRHYDHRLTADQLKDVRACLLHAIGLMSLTKHL